jgi:hypothetical protein
VLSHTKRERSAADGVGVRHVAEWMSRSVEAVRAELRFVDCGSLDVLLYCPDEVAASAHDPGVAGPADEP